MYSKLHFSYKRGTAPIFISIPATKSTYQQTESDAKHDHAQEKTHILEVETAADDPWIIIKMCVCSEWRY